MTPSQQPIADMEAEQSTLGAILVRPEVMDTLTDILKVEDFYRQAHGEIYAAMLYLYDKNEPVDLVTVSAKLRDEKKLEGVGGPVFLAGLSEQVGFATNAEYYANIVRDKARVRKLKDTTISIAQACSQPIPDVDKFLDSAETQIVNMGDRRGGIVRPLSQLVPEEEARLEGLLGKAGQLTGVGSGFTDLDQYTGGFQPSDLIIIAARPSMGKTALALDIARAAALKHKVPSLIFSMEMSEGQLTNRLISSQARVDAKLMRMGLMNGQEWAAVNKAAGRLMEAPIYICEKSAMTPMSMRSQARRAKVKYGIGMVIVDYIQLAEDPKAGSREQEISSVSRGLKHLAKDLGIPVIALSQLNRKCEERPGKRPILADLRESGAIEQDADMVMFLFRPDAYQEDEKAWNNIAELRIAKHRNGPVGLVTLTYTPKYVSFTNFTKEVGL
jgi:replicative DNA helicase